VYRIGSTRDRFSNGDPPENSFGVRRDHYLRVLLILFILLIAVFVFLRVYESQHALSWVRERAQEHGLVACRMNEDIHSKRNPCGGKPSV
jgi:hypothetical protein